MQAAFALLDTATASTVADAMEKRREISPPKPNAAPRADQERVLARLGGLGITGPDEFEKETEFGRATYFRLKKFEISTASIRKLEEWVLTEERKRDKPAAPSKTEEDQLLAEWAQLGEQLMSLNPQQFRATLEGLRDVVEGVRLQKNAYLKIFRATPDDRR